MAVAVIASMALAGWSVAASEKEKKPAKAPLPRVESVEWDVAVFEESPTFTVVKRDVKTGQVVWLLENKKAIPNGLLYCIVADFLDEDGVKLATTEVGADQFPYNWREGERNRVILQLPQAEKWKKVTKVVVKVN
jgi:hypothetical protein